MLHGCDRLCGQILAAPAAPAAPDHHRRHHLDAARREEFIREYFAAQSAAQHHTGGHPDAVGVGTPPGALGAAVPHSASDSGAMDLVRLAREAEASSRRGRGGGGASNAQTNPNKHPNPPKGKPGRPKKKKETPTCMVYDCDALSEPCKRKLKLCAAHKRAVSVRLERGGPLQRYCRYCHVLHDLDAFPKKDIRTICVMRNELRLKRSRERRRELQLVAALKGKEAEAEAAATTGVPAPRAPDPRFRAVGPRLPFAPAGEEDAEEREAAAEVAGLMQAGEEVGKDEEMEQAGRVEEEGEEGGAKDGEGE